LNSETSQRTNKATHNPIMTIAM